MNILVTGAKGFVGRNLCAQLRNIRDGKAKNYALGTDLAIFEYDIDSTAEELDEFCRKADFVFNLAGVTGHKTPKSSCREISALRQPCLTPFANTEIPVL